MDMGMSEEAEQPKTLSVVISSQSFVVDVMHFITFYIWYLYIFSDPYSSSMCNTGIDHTNRTHRRSERGSHDIYQ